MIQIYLDIVSVMSTGQ